VRWGDGWPRLTGPGEPIPYARARPKLPPQPAPPVPTSGAFAVREEFDGNRLPFHWMAMRNPRERWHRLRAGALELTPRPTRLGELGNPSLLGRRQQHLNAEASTRLDFRPAAEGDAAGLVALQNDEYWLALAVTRSAGRRIVQLRRRAGAAPAQIVASAPLPAGGPLELRIRARGAAYDFAYRSGGRWISLGVEDGRILSTRTAGGFVGVVFGLWAESAG